MDENLLEILKRSFYIRYEAKGNVGMENDKNISLDDIIKLIVSSEDVES